MKATKGSFWTALALAAALFGCQSEGVAPGGGNGKSVAGAMGDVHPMMDSTCQWSDTIYFQGIDGSLTVNKCGWEDELAAPIACTTPQEKWGYMRISNGYAFETTGNTEWVSIDFALPYGWYCSTNAWKFAVAGGMGVDANTGKPTSGNNDWSVVTYSPLRGEWKVALPLAQLPSQTSFDMACKLGITPIDVNGVPMTAYQTDLWAYKTPAVAGASPFVLNYTPVHCMATTSGGGGGNCGTPAATSSVCETVYKGVTCTGGAALGTTELVPEATGAGTAPVYNWSTGEHTSSLTVSPTTTTTYTCTVTNGTCAIRIVTFNVNVIDVACNIGGSNGGNGNSGNGGSGSGNGGSGSGNGNSTCGDVNQVVSGTGCSNNNNILGPVNNSGVLFANTGNKVTIKLDHTLPAGTQYKISWKRSGSGTASMKVSESASNSTYTQSGSTFTTSSASYVTKTLTTTASTRYLKLESTSSVDFYIDAVTYCFTPVVVTTPGVKVCHVPPGNPGGATTVCVSYAQLGSHLSGVCSASNGGGNGGNGGSGSGSGSNSGSGSGSGHGGNANCGPNHHNGNHSGCSHNSTHPANCGNGHSSGNHGGCSHQGGGRSGSGGSSSHSGGHQGCGNGAGAGHAEDYIGPCNANPCQ